MRIAVIADLHANLEATLAAHRDIQARGISEIWCLGDLVGKGPRPREVLEWTKEHVSRCVQGNWDVRVAGATHRLQDVWPRAQLSAAALKFLGGLPYGFEETLAGQSWRFVHAGSKGVFQRLYPHSSLEEQCSAYEPNPELGLHAHAGALVYADIHETLLLDVEGRPLLNPGSVGNPLDSTLPSYLILDFGTQGYSLQFVRFAYNRDAEIAAAEASDMPFVREYISELLTGRYQKRRA